MLQLCVVQRDPRECSGEDRISAMQTFLFHTCTITRQVGDCLSAVLCDGRVLCSLDDLCAVVCNICVHLC